MCKDLGAAGAGARGALILTWAEVEKIANRFSSLNPHGRTAVKRSILNLVDANFLDSDSTKPQRQQFAATEYGRKGKVVASEDVQAKISSIGIDKCARESGFDRKNFIRKLIRDIPGRH